MNDPVISFSREIEEFMKVNPRLFQAIMDAMPVSVQVLKAVRGENNEIIDFNFSFSNASAKAYTHTGKNFLGQDGNNPVAFQQLVEVVETGSPLQVDEQFGTDGNKNWFGAKYVKFGDGILVSRENVPGLNSGNGNSGLRNELNYLAAKIANVGNWQWDIETGEVTWADNTFRLLGYEPFSFKPSIETFFHSVHPDDRQRIIEASEKVKADSVIVRAVYEYRIITRDTGKTRYIRSISEPYHLDGKKLMIGTLIDITEEVNLLHEISEKNRLLQEDLAMQRKASSALANFKNIIEASTDPIITIDLLGKISYWSPGAVSLHGYSYEEVIGKTLWEIIVPASKKKDLETVIVKVHKEGQSVRNMTTQSKRKDGQLLDIILTIFPLKDEFGKITGSCVIMRDRTEQIKNAEKIKEDALFIGQVADTTPDIIYILDLNTYQVIYTNRQAAEDLHYTTKEISMMKNPILDLIHPEDLDKMLDHLEKIKKIENNKIVEIEYRLKTQSGEYEWYCDRSAVFKRDSYGIAVEKIGISQRISDRKVKEQQLHTILDILNHAEFLSKMGSWEYDIITGDFKWSKGMYHLFSLPAGTTVTPEIYLDFAVTEEKPVAGKIVNCIKHDFTPFEEIMTVVPAEQEKKILKIKGVLIKDKKKNPVRMIGVDLDITEQVKATNRIRDLNRELSVKNEDLQSLNNELKIFNNITANDYKETLQTLYTNLEFIASKEARNLSDAAKANIRRAQSAIQKMKLLTSDINMYLELYENPVILSPVDPNEILQTVLAKEQRKIEQYNAEIEVTHFPILPSHPVLLSQLFSSLIDNAIKFRKVVLPPVIKIKYSQADEMNSIPVAVKNMPYGIISVSDNGIGFDEEEAERIFDLFYRASDNVKYKGSGIGLSICKKIMSLHGGFITAEGARAHGATINCYFPLKKI